MTRIFRTAAATVALAFAFPLAAAAAISPGTQLTGYIQPDLSSNHAYAGERFTLYQVRSGNGMLAGATIYGHVSDVQTAGQGRPGRIRLAFDTLVTRAGDRYALDARPVHVDVVTKSNAGKEVAGAVGGAVVGSILGHAIGLPVGGLLGAGGGYLAARNNRQNVDIPGGSSVTIQVIGARLQRRG